MLVSDDTDLADLVRDVVPDVRLLTGDITDLSSLIRALSTSQPDEVYNLGAVSFVAYSWENARLTSDVTGLGVPAVVAELGRHQDRTAGGLDALGHGQGRGVGLVPALAIAVAQAHERPHHLQPPP